MTMDAGMKLLSMITYINSNSTIGARPVEYNFRLCEYVTMLQSMLFLFMKVFNMWLTLSFGMLCHCQLHTIYVVLF